MLYVENHGEKGENREKPIEIQAGWRLFRGEGTAFLR